LSPPQVIHCYKCLSPRHCRLHSCIVRPPPVEPFHPLLEDAKPLSYCFPFTAYRSHSNPIRLRTYTYHGPPSTTTVELLGHMCNARRMKWCVAAFSRRCELYAKQLPVVRIDRRPEEVVRSIYLDLDFIDRDRTSAPWWRYAKQRLRPVVPLPCRLI